MYHFINKEISLHFSKIGGKAEMATCDKFLD